jgi:hypothetical protein
MRNSDFNTQTMIKNDFDTYECGAKCDFDKQESDFDTISCNFDTHKSDFNKQIVIFGDAECGFGTIENGFYRRIIKSLSVQMKFKSKKSINFADIL